MMRKEMDDLKKKVPNGICTDLKHILPEMKV